MEGIILVEKIPECCEHCKRCTNQYEDDTTKWCSITGLGRPNDFKNQKPDWCPIKEIPKKKDYSNLSEQNLTRIWGNGWNACIDTLMELLVK